MPRRSDIQKILLIGSGPIVIGQGCEFDYSGTQALKALKEEGYFVILVNSNPATIMTDPDLADRVYLEPLTCEYLTKIIEIERPHALLPTLGGQTALNLTMALFAEGVLKKFGVEILGANPEVIHRAEDRETFKATMDSIGVQSAKSFVARSVQDGSQAIRELGLPLVLRPSFTLGGEGGGIARTEAEFYEKLEHALFLSPTHDVLIEESLLGWKEFELEVVRDKKDNVVIVCSIENFDPMGIHTGDSITVAPAQTLTDREYQNLRDQAIRIIRAVGVETGGSNIQFAIHPQSGRILVIEMNPRVSRSSALASKATGFPIARVAAKLAVGYTLDELTNDITGTTPCSFEPSIDYVVVKLPRFDFEKFRPTPPFLGTQMKSVGEVMAIGGTFDEALGKALCGLETQRRWLSSFEENLVEWDWIEKGHANRIWAIADAILKGISAEEIADRSKIDLWFLKRLEGMLSFKKSWPMDREAFRQVKRLGWTDQALAAVFHLSESEVRREREKMEVFPSFQAVDTCAAEFEAKTPYLYSTYWGTSDESRVSTKPKVLVLGGGPNRIGQGIEFDYCCVHAAFALRNLGVEIIMVNSNPETVSTDFDISDKLYFEPLTVEHILNIARIEKPMGVIVQFGGQTPLKLARALEQEGLKILGTSPTSIDWAEDREKFETKVRDLISLGLEQPPGRSARTPQDAVRFAHELGYPVLLRPSYVLGGRGMKIIRNEIELNQWINEAIEVSEAHPVLVDRYLENAIEVDVDALCDGRETIIGGVMEHIEEAGIHSGDSACSLPPRSLSNEILTRIRGYTRELAKRLEVIGLLNVQFAVQGSKIFLLEVNPRASRTVPFVSKAIGKPLAKLAVQIMMGKTLHDLNIREDLDLKVSYFNVKVPVFPFLRFPGVDTLLGPEMKSTGEVVGRGKTFAEAYAKGLCAAGIKLPRSGTVLLSVENEKDAQNLESSLVELGFQVSQNEKKPQFDLLIQSALSEEKIRRTFAIRRTALEKRIPSCAVMSGATVLVEAIRENQKGFLGVLAL